MDIYAKIFLALAIIFALIQLFRFRQCVVKGGVIIIPLNVSATILFILCIIGVLISGVSPFHLIWMLVVCYVVGVVLFFFPWYQKLLFAFLGLLIHTSPKRMRELSETPQPRKRKKKKRKQ